MTKIQLKENTSPQDFIRASSIEILENIWTVDWSELEDFEIIPGHRMADDVWIVPHHWIALGTGHRRGQRTMDFSKRLPAGWDRTDERSENAIRRTKRIAALLFTRTLKITNTVRSPKKPRSWVSDVNMMLKLAAESLKFVGLGDRKTNCPDGDPIFSHLTEGQFKSMVQVCHSGSRCSVITRLNSLLAHGEFDDWPATDVAEGEVPHIKTSYLPFSDAFTAELAKASLWMSEVLGPDIIECWAGILKISSKIKKSNSKKLTKHTGIFLEKFIEERRLDGDEFEFKIKVLATDNGKIVSRIASRWTDLKPNSVRSLATRLQDAHATLLALCMAPRNGELASLPRDCLRDCKGGGIVRGFTFKLSETEEERDWPIPSVAVKVVRQQMELAEILDPGGANLFVAFRSDAHRRNPRDKLELKPNAFTDFIYLSDGRSLTSLCEGRVHSHRFRKTVARLAALALVGANQILFDILGHRDPEMTMNYILADPRLQEEMQQIAKEATIATATTAFDDVDGNGGPAAVAVAEIAGRIKVRSGLDELDEASLVAAATLLSQDGHVTLVKKGVLCTKTSSQMGECVRSLGVPDIGNCKVTCMHRLELAAAKSDHKNALDQALDEIAGAGPLMRSWWQAQILTHLVPFPDLRAEMMADDRVKKALEDVDPATLEQLWCKTPLEVTKQLEEMS
jgi:hypothetical protein